MDNSVVSYQQLCDDYQSIEQAISFLEENYRHQPALKEVAGSVNLSEFHFQRLFTRWVGISPKRYLQYLTKESAKRLLEKSKSLLDVTYETGLSSPGRLHDLFVGCEAVTPGEYKERGAGLTIRFGFHPSPFGECLLGVTGRGICHLSFVDQHDRPGALDIFRRRWLRAELLEDPASTLPLIDRIFSPLNQKRLPPLHLFLNGTNFQIKVWEALLRVPAGYAVSYEDIAVSIGKPSAPRAVSNALAQNPIAFLIPCHRVIRKTGDHGGYRYGTARKKALLAWEQAINIGVTGE